MENREIIIANTRTQRRYKIVTNATTLGELKAAIDANETVMVKGADGIFVPNTEPIDYTGLSFTEGITNTEMKSDESQLPQNVNYKGQITNNLMMLLTNTRKKIESGITGSRSEAYLIIQQNGMQEAIKEHFGRNYTQVTSNDLWAFINDNIGDPEEDVEDDIAEDNPTPECPQCEYTEDVDDEEDDCDEVYEDDEFDADENTQKGEESPVDTLANFIYDIIKMFFKTGVLTIADLEGLTERTEELAKRTKETHAPIRVGNIEVSDDDIEAMIANLG